MHTLLNDPIDVAVDFAGSRIRPRHIVWDKKAYQIQTVNLIHRTKEGETNIYYFSVSDNANFFKLRLDTHTLEWRLVELYTA